MPRQEVMRVRDTLLAHRHEIVGAQVVERGRAGGMARQHGGEGGKIGWDGQAQHVRSPWRFLRGTARAR